MDKINYIYMCKEHNISEQIQKNDYEVARTKQKRVVLYMQ